MFDFCNCSFIAAPIELVKIQLQNQHTTTNTHKNTVTSLVKIIYKQHGVKGYFRGLNVTVLRELNYGVYFSAYEYICLKLAHYNDERTIEPKQTTLASHHLNGYQLVLAGGVAGMVCWGCTYPLGNTHPHTLLHVH